MVDGWTDGWLDGWTEGQITKQHKRERGSPGMYFFGLEVRVCACVCVCVCVLCVLSPEPFTPADLTLFGTNEAWIRIQLCNLEKVTNPL